MKTSTSKRGPNYTGFKERFYLVKDGRITLAYLDGSGAFDVFKDTHQVGHFQFCPDDSTIGIYCHEGPWHLVTQRIWLLDFASRRRGLVSGRERTILWATNFGPVMAISSSTIAAPVTMARSPPTGRRLSLPMWRSSSESFVPFVGLADRKGNVVRRMDMPYYTNHYHANPDNTLLVGDDVDDLVLIDISRESARSAGVVQPQNLLAYPVMRTVTPRGVGMARKILFASDYIDGNPQHLDQLAARQHVRRAARRPCGPRTASSRRACAACPCRAASRASGSHTTTSASAPTAIVPFLPYMPKIFAGAVDVISTKRFIEILPARTPSHSRCRRVSTPGMPFGIFEKSPRPSSF